MALAVCVDDDQQYIPRVSRSVLRDSDVLLFGSSLEGRRQIGSKRVCCVDSSARRIRCLVSPDAGEGGLDLALETGDEFAVGGDEGLLGFDFGDDGLLGS